MNFLEKLKKTLHTILYELFSAEGQTEGRTDIINWSSQFSYVIKERTAHLQEICENLWHF